MSYRPFGDLLHFKKDPKATDRRQPPKVLVVAPMSGHYATLLRGTVRAMIPEHDVYVTDWRDARNVPLVYGGFDFDDFVDYVIDFIRLLGPDTHVIAVCQPSVPVLVAAAVMARSADPCQPLSLTLMGGPIDTRKNPTAVKQARPVQGYRLVQAQRHQPCADAACRCHARGLSGLHPAFRIHDHEPRSPCRGPFGGSTST